MLAADTLQSSVKCTCHLVMDILWIFSDL